MPRTTARVRRLTKDPVVRSIACCLALCVVDATFRSGRGTAETACASESCH